MYLWEPSDNIISNYHGVFIHIFMHGYYPINIYIYLTIFCQCYLLFADVSSFLLMLLLNSFIFYKFNFSLELISLNFLSCRLPQSNLLQSFICYSIMKRQVQKPKLSFISFHLYGMMITSWGLMKKNWQCLWCNQSLHIQHP